jgi:adenylate kinase
MKLVLIGCPGAGKGTQAKKLSAHFDNAHISTGDLLRDEIKSGY